MDRNQVPHNRIYLLQSYKVLVVQMSRFWPMKGGKKCWKTNAALKIQTNGQTQNTHTKKKKTFQVDYKKTVVLKLRSLILGIISDQEVQTNPVIFMFRLWHIMLGLTLTHCDHLITQERHLIYIKHRLNSFTYSKLKQFKTMLVIGVIGGDIYQRNSCPTTKKTALTLN